MKIHLIDIDSTIPNLALIKVRKYYQDRGYEVIYNFPLLIRPEDKIYVSCIFKENRPQAAQYLIYPNAIIGGSGYDLNVRLPEEIEAVKPRINYGFTTRGCIRKCKFCIVPEKEGDIHITGDLLDIWDGKSKDITLMDNNILALPDHFKKICRQARENNIRIDFNQGLDHRLLTYEIVLELKRTSIKQYRFAYDSPSMRQSVNRAIALLKSVGINQSMWYILVGFNTMLKEDVTRINHLRFTGQRAYIQRYSKDRKYIPMARWQNQKALCNMPFYNFIKLTGKEDYYDKWLDLYMNEVGEKAMKGPLIK